MRSLLGSIPLLLLVAASAAPARTWNVCADGSGDAPTIQAAADSSAPGDSILLGPGAYPEAVTLPHDLTLKGTDGAVATSIDGGFVRQRCLDSVLGVAVLLEGLTFEGAVVDQYSGDCRAAAVTIHGDGEIRNCRFRDNQAFDREAALVGSRLTVVNCEFTGNSGFTGGAYCSPYPDAACGRACIVAGWLDVQECLFESNHCTLIDAAGGRIADSVFRGNRAGDYFAGIGLLTGAIDLIENNLFVDNTGPLLVAGYDCEIPPAPQLRIVGNTFARNPDLFVDCPVPAGCTVERNVFTGSAVGLALPAGGGGVVADCNDSWGNDVNWGGPDLDGLFGNFSEPPLYCNAPGEDFSVAANSPLLPGNNDCGVLIGAFGSGCLPLSIEPSSWGRIKAGYRSTR